MGATTFAFSVVVSTLGRTQELSRLLESLEQQSLKDFEVVIVDQNDDDRLCDILSPRPWSFTLTHVHTPHQRGVSRGRNVGWRRARGRVMVFADDDCWCAPWFLAKADTLLKATGADIVTGRAADETGRSINARFETTAQSIDRKNVWTTSIEWMIFFRRGVLEALGGFDATIGPGADTPWQASEGQEIILRALSAGFHCYFDPSLYGFHAELNVRSPDAAMLHKARGYSRGMGFVMRRHGFGLATAIYWITRPSIAVVIHTILGNGSRVLYYLNVARGRLEGWCQTV